jgi:ABC-type antimicrobial peptide transport system permease subunit
VVGVVDDAHLSGLEESARTAVYVSLPPRRWTPWVGNLVVRSELPAAEVVQRVRDIARGLDPAVPLYRIQTMDSLLQGSLWRSRLAAALLTSLGMVGLLVAVVGTHAVIALAVNARNREFGIRAALGASGRSLSGLVARSVASLLAVSIAVAIPLTLAVFNAIGGVIPASIGVAAPMATATIGVLVTVALVCWPAVRRAARADPAQLLREA